MIIEVEVPDKIKEVAKAIFEKLELNEDFKKEAEEAIIANIIKTIIEAVVNRRSFEVSNAKIMPSYSMPWVYVFFSNNMEFIIKFEGGEVVLKHV